MKVSVEKAKYECRHNINMISFYIQNKKTQYLTYLQKVNHIFNAKCYLYEFKTETDYFNTTNKRILYYLLVSIKYN